MNTPRNVDIASVSLKKEWNKFDKVDIIKGPYPWVDFPADETPLKRKFREAVIIDPKYIENDEEIHDQELIGTEMTGCHATAKK